MNYKKAKELATLFSLAYAQVLLVAFNTVFLANGHYVGVTVVSFSISFVWSFNVKRIALGTMPERLTYSLGASIGGLTGLLISSALIK
jgi:hypothetical protein